MTIHHFAQLSFFDQVTLLKNNATLIDNYLESGHLILVYSLHNFFIEATIDNASETIKEVIPYKRGFLISKRYLHDHLRTHLLSYSQVA